MSINTDGAEVMFQRIRELTRALEAGSHTYNPLYILDHLSEIKPATTLNETLALLLAQHGVNAVSVALDEELQKI